MLTAVPVHSEKNHDEALLILCERLPSLADTLLEDDDESTYLSIVTTQVCIVTGGA